MDTIALNAQTMAVTWTATRVIEAIVVAPCANRAMPIESQEGTISNLMRLPILENRQAVAASLPQK